MEIYAMTTADAVTVAAHLTMMLIAAFSYRHALDSHAVPASVRRRIR